MSPSKKIYIGCALTSAPDTFKAAVKTIKADLRPEFEVFDFVGLVDGTPADVYHWDIQRCVAECDLFVAICDYPAIGLGYELGYAVEKLAKPTLALAHKDAHITRLVLGVDAPFYSFKRYESIEAVPGLIRKYFSEIKAKEHASER